ncbi:MAG: LysR family transcriptional regulator [Oscillospiraceae bacterium]
MESKKLEALLMAVDLGSFTKAAEVLGYTQSGLTHMMNSLEKEIGFPVLVRGRSGVSLTAEGRRIEPAVREFLQANTRLNHVIAQAGAAKGEVLRISAYASIAMHWLPAIIQQFRSECPNVDVDIRMADHVDGPYELLENGTMDAIFVSRQDEGSYDWIHLKDDAMYAVLPKYYTIGKRRSFPVAEFDGKEFIMPSQGFDKDILRIFNRLNVRPDIRPTAVDDQTVISMVAHGLGVSMMTELTLKGRAEAVMIRPVAPASSRELGVAVRSMQEASAALVRFIDCTQRVIGNMLEK